MKAKQFHLILSRAVVFLTVSAQWSIFIVFVISIFFSYQVQSQDNKILKKSIVSVEVGKKKGHGLIQSQDEQSIYIVTCEHIVRGNGSAKVIFNPEVMQDGVVICCDSTIDFALIEVARKELKLREELNLADFEENLDYRPSKKKKTYRMLALPEHVSKKPNIFDISIEFHDTTTVPYVFSANPTILERYSGAPIFDGEKIIGIVIEKDEAKNDTTPKMLPSSKIIQSINLFFLQRHNVRIEGDKKKGYGLIHSKDEQSIYIVTCEHIVRGNESAKVIFNKEVEQDGLVFLSDSTIDFAIIKVSRKELKLKDELKRANFEEDLNYKPSKKKEYKIFALNPPDMAKPYCKDISIQFHDTTAIHYAFSANPNISVGYSGVPVFDEKKIIGIVIEKEYPKDNNMSYMLPSSKFIQFKHSPIIHFEVRDKDTNDFIKNAILTVKIDEFRIRGETNSEGFINIKIEERFLNKKGKYIIQNYSDYMDISNEFTVFQNKRYKIYMSKRCHKIWNINDSIIFGTWGMLTFCLLNLLFNPYTFTIK